MSKNTNIQWCTSTINPVMGCGGCELFPNPPHILKKIDDAVATIGANVKSQNILKPLINEHYAKIKNPHPGHRNAVTTTNIWHFRELLFERITKLHGRDAGIAAKTAIETSVTCYAAKLHLNRAANILNPERGLNKGYASTFEQLTTFGGRMAEAAAWPDMLGQANPETPWKDGLPRMIFVSDMGDALTNRKHFPFLEREVADSITTEKGLRHLWLWLTKRPKNMRDFADLIGGFTANVCAMTTITGPDTLGRVDELRQVDAPCRGLSIEPLWDRIPPELLDLSGISWVIVGGESGSGPLTRPFYTEWAEELYAHCRKHRVAFFLKQLGRNPYTAGKSIRLTDPHGGDWTEWPAHLRVREFPRYFHNYRQPLF
jgi:protein gp37